MTDTPGANRTHVAFFGLRNAGKSTLVNAFTGQDLAIVSDTPGTTTDPVSKAMEILPLGPCLVTDTAGLDDAGALGEQRVKRTLDVLATTDVAVWVWGADAPAGATLDRAGPQAKAFADVCARRRIRVLEYRRGDSVEALRRAVAALAPEEPAPGLLDGFVRPGDHVVCVCPIDAAAPKGRLILPQVQAIRACLDLHAVCTVCPVEELAGVLGTLRAAGVGRLRVITDSQAFAGVRAAIDGCAADVRAAVALTSFSILFARQKGDLAEFRRGLDALKNLKDGDLVVVSEACTHHRQCGDIGTVRIPAAVKKLTGKTVRFAFTSGGTFEPCPQGARAALVIHCGGCMLTRRAMLERIAGAKAYGVPIVNYGLVLAAACGVEIADPEEA